MSYFSPNWEMGLDKSGIKNTQHDFPWDKDYFSALDLYKKIFLQTADHFRKFIILLEIFQTVL